MSIAPVHWHLETNWGEVPVRELPHDLLVQELRVGPPESVDAPLVVRVQFPPGYAVAPHWHRCDYSEFIMAGSQQVTRRWHRAGDIRVVKAGTVYGPLVAGPEGATVINVFSSSDTAAVYVRPGHRSHGPRIEDLQEVIGG